MMVAYLRGLLQPSHKYGAISRAAETVKLELLGASLAAEDYAIGALADSVRLLLTPGDALHQAARSADVRLQKANSLRFADIFRDSKAQQDKSTPSLYQLYQMAQKHGIMEAVRNFNPPTKDLLRR
jgi:hypothetical protein